MGFIGKQPAKAAITSSDITDGIVTADKLASDSVTTAKIADNGVTTAKINADAVTDAKIADDVIGTEHLTAGEVDTTALGADAVTAAKIADDAIDSEHYTDGSIDTAHIADLNVTSGKIAADAITAAKIADDAISDEHLDPTAITGQTAETSVANDDLILISDTSASAALKKMTVANLVANAGGGKLLQVVGGTIGSTEMANTTGYVGSGLSITPSSSSSKVLVIMGGNTERYSGNSSTYSSIQLHRDTTNLYSFHDAIQYKVITSVRQMFNVNYLDSPSTTSAVQYRIYHTIQSGSPSVRYYQHWALLEIDGS